MFFFKKAYYIHSCEDGHTNPYMTQVSQQLPTSCGRAWVKLECAAILFVDFLIVFFYVTEDRSYVLFVTLSTIRIFLHFTIVMIAHFGAVKELYQYIMIDQHIGSDDACPLLMTRSLKNRFQFLMLAKLSVISLIIQGIFMTVQIIQQASILFVSSSLDYPSEWLDSYFTFLAMPQMFQLWASLGIGSGLYFLFAHCALVTESPRDIKLGLQKSQALINQNNNENRSADVEA